MTDRIRPEVAFATRADLMAHPDWAFMSNDGEGNPCVWLNSYRCDDCSEEWDDEWSCKCDDRCPICDEEHEPYKSEWNALSDHGEHTRAAWLTIWSLLPEAGAPLPPVTDLAARRVFTELDMLTIRLALAETFPDTDKNQF